MRGRRFTGRWPVQWAIAWPRFFRQFAQIVLTVLTVVPLPAFAVGSLARHTIATVAAKVRTTSELTPLAGDRVGHLRAGRAATLKRTLLDRARTTVLTVPAASVHLAVVSLEALRTLALVPAGRGRPTNATVFAAHIRTVFAPFALVLGRTGAATIVPLYDRTVASVVAVPIALVGRDVAPLAGPLRMAAAFRFVVHDHTEPSVLAVARADVVIAVLAVVVRRTFASRLAIRSEHTRAIVAV